MSQQLSIQVAGSPTYKVSIQSNVCERLASSLPAECPTVALIMDTNLEALYSQRIRSILSKHVKVEIFIFPAGEGSKTRSTKERIEDQMVASGLGRDCVVVAVGGGVTLDLSGFIASTYMRGVDWIGVPTSLLAAVDASIGGKTGVNVPAGKNLVGTFHQPLAVLIDPNLMKTLPAEEVDNGLAEMVKHAVVADRVYLDQLIENEAALRSLEPEVTGQLISRSVEIKAWVVSQDPHEGDLRQVLNFGHTIGHAIEMVNKFDVRHGLAVAMGMSVEAEIACRLGLMNTAERDWLRSCLKILRLPRSLPIDTDPVAVLRATRVDKKGRKGIPRYVLPKVLGKMAKGSDGYGHRVDDEIVLQAVRENQQCCV